ncbi:succinylglutamate desuccinylase/aspartoacylase family protein [Pricia sp. S334]|uniref:Succinylglutamate desuccinylase/aspartoacylase family protein n=1 Tax=Pricia mediterranea TaxID=3076079 RepID=A0ABU3L2V6_9FLAO|nr:succinylglutamate desuccinylase/aspartoacylase family protein [Pricia sp. S334]MDT7827970.1 succinylglutamate desuccinylase/aspartoacylase family protein [Pricia sp. S334]
MDENRIIGTYGTDNEGPLLFISAGIHGNEPSGVVALEKVIDLLEREKPEISGKVVGVYGNRTALEKGVRYIDEDLNRTWTERNVEAQKKDSNEKKEMFEIIDVLECQSRDGYRKRYFLDCHTTSSDSLPYISVQEVGENDAWAHRFPVHIIRGFSDIVFGCIDHYLSRIGLTGFVFEGGQHQSPDAIRYHEGMIWLALVEACGLDLERLSEFPQAVEKTTDQRRDQKTFEIIHRHSLEDDDRFAMEPGYENFQTIEKGELLATHNGKKIISRWNAHIFMPLYQTQGNDGFFVVEEVEVE